ncbi:MAG: ATP-binding protein [Desulfobacterales bacterium]
MFERWISVPSEKSCLIIGPRRCGKTSLLRHRYPDLRYVTLDDLDLLDWAKRDPKGFVTNLQGTAAIDEIQRLPLLTVAVKYAIDNENGRFLMTGSSSIGLLDAAADTLAGRINIQALPTLCWGEQLGRPTHSIFNDQAAFTETRTARRALRQALSYGLFPEVAALKKDSDRQSLLQNYKNTYFTRDLMQLSNIENLDGLLGIFHHLARSIGSHLEVSNFARESDLSHQTAKKYLNALSQAQLAFKLYGFQYGPAKRYLKASKTYFSDNGILSSLNVAVSIGQQIENFVISELEKRRKLGFIKAEHLYYYKSAAGHEIDLIFETNGCLHACEIKATERPGPRDFRNLRNFKDRLNRPVKRFLFYMGDRYENHDGVIMIPIASLYRGR